MQRRATLMSQSDEVNGGRSENRRFEQLHTELVQKRVEQQQKSSGQAFRIGAASHSTTKTSSCNIKSRATASIVSN
ncbi:hypothetical protein PoB_003968300 [Plakobranchus ocellatus]|uniref:Uncharacterized protein n=1 Tax=Plakobranchus ocellatus TaxID=259542 RepID=A0AAV4B0U8_9GAST|nr:hypothetical protein PoB_003968300 [Plakobranchus ocellatus]